MSGSPFLAELSRNNELPSEEEVQVATALRSQASEELLHIDAEIQRLKEKREQVQKSFDTWNTILSPVRRLPPDILGNVFYHCLTTSRNPILSAKEAPMLLTRVCSLWRSVALSTPQIWARLYIPLPGDPQIDSYHGVANYQALEGRRKVFSKMIQLRCQVVKEWLDRSGSCPLSLSISYPHGYVLHDDEMADSLFQIIRPSALRWSHLDLSMPYNIYEKLEKIIPVENLSMLREFKANICYPDSTPPIPPTFLALHIIDLPTLDTLSINCPQMTLNLGRYQNPWNHFTEIRFHSSVSDIDILNMFKQCQNLITLEAVTQPWAKPEVPPPPREIILLPHLENLKLWESGPSSTAFSTVQAPSLKSLHHRCARHYGTPFAGSLNWLVSNAAASLRTLSINPRTLRSQDVLECLRLATHLQKLILGDSPFSPNAAPEFEDDIRSDYFDLEAFTIRTTEDVFSPITLLQNDILLPHLESLEANDNYKIDDDNLCRILKSRIDAARRGLTSPLGSVKIKLGRQKEGDIIPEIVAHAQDVGMEMKLQLFYPPVSPPYFGRLSPSFLLPVERANGCRHCRGHPHN